jgi:ABC-2 type transport system permease protein
MNMNIFIRELRANLKNFIIWSVGMIILLTASMAKYSTVSNGGQMVQKLMDQFPITIQSIFGMNGLDIMTVRGYFGVMFLYIAIMVAIHAGLLGADLLSKEEQEKTAEFLYVRPISRARVITEKFFAGIVIITALNIITLLSSFLSVAKFTTLDSIAPEIWLFAMAMGIIQLLFFAVGFAIAAICRNPKMPSKIIAILVLVSYIIYVFVKVAPAIWYLKYLSPFMYFDAKAISNSMALNGQYIFICLIIVLISVFVTYRFYCNRDLQV